MLSLDDRTGNILTTVALFAGAAVLTFAVRTTILVCVLALLFAYLLEPPVGFVQRWLPSRAPSRGIAIATVYIGAAAALAAAVYVFAPAFIRQYRELQGDLSALANRAANVAGPARGARLMTRVSERAMPLAAVAARDLAWLLWVPIVAVFLQSDRQRIFDSIVDVFARRHDRARVKSTIEHVDVMLAEYTRAQLALAGLSVAFYAASAAVLGFPYPLALAALGLLDFIPVVGWIAAAAIVLFAGWSSHAHWIWMAGLLVVWRGLQNFVYSPRIMGNRLKLEPLTVLLAVMAGGEIGGMVGAVLSVPVVAVLKILWNDRKTEAKTAVA
ncbi:MAG TPA: AI-2E family transporter [Vicinamibacterales bacterium]|nr:AI-2E family transporter [Vicinamibacterales bacterium]